MSERVCEHCEAAGELDRRGLCRACREVDGIRVLYVRRRGWTSAWEEHLRRLTRRAQAGQPLFDEGCC